MKKHGFQMSDMIDLMSYLDIFVPDQHKFDKIFMQCFPERLQFQNHDHEEEHAKLFANQDQQLRQPTTPTPVTSTNTPPPQVKSQKNPSTEEHNTE